MESKIKLLSTATLPVQTVNDAAGNGVAIEILPFIETTFIKTPELQQHIKTLAQQHLVAVFTSAQAVESVKALASPLQPNWDVYCVANETQNKVQEHFNDVTIAAIGNNANDVARKIIGHSRNEATFFCSDIRMNHLPEALQQAGIKVNETIVYQTKEVHHKIEAVYDGIMFYSPSGVRSFFKNNSVPPETILFSIGITTAAAISEFSKNKVIISELPSKDFMANEAVAYFRNKQ